MRHLRPALSKLTLPLALLLVAAGVGCSCSEDDAGETGGAAEAVDRMLVRERVAAHFGRREHTEASELIAPLLAGDDALPADLVTGAQIRLRLHDWEGARALLERALAKAPDDPAAHYSLAHIALSEGDPEAALVHYEAALRAAPDDVATKLGLAHAIDQADRADEIDRAIALYDEIIDLGLESGTNWYVTAVYRRSELTTRFRTEEEARKYHDLWRTLADSGFEALKDEVLQEGTLARVVAPRPTGTSPAGRPAAPTYDVAKEVLPELAGARFLDARDLDGDRRPDLLAASDAGAVIALQRDDGWLVQRPHTGAVAMIRAIDLNQARSGDSLDLVLLLPGGEITVLEQRDDAQDAVAWEPSPVPVPACAGAVDLVPVDFDHDGDLDLFAAGAGGAHLLRNDGAGVRVDKKTNLELPRGAWSDVTAETGLPRGALTWAAIEDMDADQDVDLLCGGPEVTHLLSSLRAGRFEDLGTAAFGGAVLGGRPAFADLDGDGRADVVEPGAPARLWRSTANGAWTPVSLGAPIPLASEPRIADLDLDGAADVVFALEGRLGGAILAAGFDSRLALELPPLAGANGPLLALELDPPGGARELAVDLVRATGGGVAVARPTSALGNALYVKYIGQKDNRQAVGAVLEVRARELYRRIFLRGEAEVVGLGAHDAADVLRVTWPNGVVQHRLDVAAGGHVANPGSDEWRQVEGLVGSCPFLYAFDGRAFTFVSDVLGITPLGLPMAPGVLVPPDHDEYVLVTGEQLAPNENGEYVLQLTEELREVTYLDRARLDVVDHPVSSEVFPDERFTFPPFPPAHLHTVERALAPARAMGSDGRDWAAELAAADDVHARPFERLGGQFLGLAEPHWLELEFAPDALAGASLLRLVCTGWFYWTDASVNMAAARTPGVEFVPPIVEVPDGAGGWRPIGPPVGFPAGKTKTMVIDVSAHVVREDPRVRIRSTLELYWDRIALAVCGDDAERRVTSLEASVANLWPRGFSEPVERAREDLPERFDWDVLEPRARWNQHPGRYTRYGDVRELTGAIDDRFVILGAGDALELRFDASTLPPLPEGWRRDFLVFLDGWAKDRDPNTLSALEVEPLPFHGMSAYPYGPEEAFPDTEAHRRWREEWNTRPAYLGILPLSSAGLEEWLGSESASR